MVFIMSRCNQCKIEILDATDVCPLCKSVLELDEDDFAHTSMYPDIRQKDHKLHIFMRIYLFASFCIEALLIYLNFIYFHGTYWAAITGGIFAYGLLTLNYAVLHNAGYLAKIIVQTFCGMILVVLIDFSLGFNGWSLNYVFPAGVLAVDVGIIILMIVNSRNWQSYILFQLFMTLWSLLPIFLYQKNIITDPVLSIIALVFSAILFLGTFIIGGRRASTELKRRFHVR